MPVGRGQLHVEQKKGVKWGGSGSGVHQLDLDLVPGPLGRRHAELDLLGVVSGLHSKRLHDQVELSSRFDRSDGPLWPHDPD